MKFNSIRKLKKKKRKIEEERRRIEESLIDIS